MVSSMAKINNIYDFYYKWTEDDRQKSVGTSIIEGRYTYYPVSLSNSCFNYGHKYGLIGVLQPPRMYLNAKQKLSYKGDLTWIKIYAFSPDDLDLGLHYDNNKHPEKLYKLIITFLDHWASSFVNMSYEDILQFCQKELGGKLGD